MWCYYNKALITTLIVVVKQSLATMKLGKYTELRCPWAITVNNENRSRALGSSTRRCPLSRNFKRDDCQKCTNPTQAWWGTQILESAFGHAWTWSVMLSCAVRLPVRLQPRAPATQDLSLPEAQGACSDDCLGPPQCLERFLRHNSHLFSNIMYVGRILNTQKLPVLKTTDSVLKLRLYYYSGVAGQQVRRQLSAKREFVTHRSQERGPSPGDHSGMHWACLEAEGCRDAWAGAFHVASGEGTGEPGWACMGLVGKGSSRGPCCTGGCPCWLVLGPGRIRVGGCGPERESP